MNGVFEILGGALPILGSLYTAGDHVLDEARPLEIGHRGDLYCSLRLVSQINFLLFRYRPYRVNVIILLG